MAPPRKWPMREAGYAFGYWEVIRHVPRSHAPGKNAGYYMRCTLCGTEHFTTTTALERGDSTRCGQCRLKNISMDTHSNAAKTDQVVIDRLIRRWQTARGRCLRPDYQNYHNYGGRGIKIHIDWQNNVRAFIMYAITLPGFDDPALDMDRINNDEGYVPGNIRFCTRSENILNSRPSLEKKT